MNYKVGVDEAGRGPWAGPVFAGIVILNQFQEQTLQQHGVTDSKKLTEKRRNTLYKLILENSTFAKVKFLRVEDIDRVGIYQATQILIQQLVEEIPEEFNDTILIDGVFPGLQLYRRTGALRAHECIIKGDTKEVAISAASILAKVRRDMYMIDLDKKYPQYLFAKHKGYGTALHVQTLKSFGPCSEHRRSFKPIKDLIDREHVE